MFSRWFLIVSICTALIGSSATSTENLASALKSSFSSVNYTFNNYLFNLTFLILFFDNVHFLISVLFNCDFSYFPLNLLSYFLYHQISFGFFQLSQWNQWKSMLFNAIQCEIERTQDSLTYNILLQQTVLLFFDSDVVRLLDLSVSLLQLFLMLSSNLLDFELLLQLNQMPLSRLQQLVCLLICQLGKFLRLLILLHQSLDPIL